MRPALALVPSLRRGPRRTLRAWQAERMREIDRELATLRARVRDPHRLLDDQPDHCGRCGQRRRLRPWQRLWLCPLCLAVEQNGAEYRRRLRADGIA